MPCDGKAETVQPEAMPSELHCERLVGLVEVFQGLWWRCPGENTISLDEAAERWPGL